MHQKIIVDPRPDKTNSWNNFSKKPEKYVDMVCTEKVIKYDGEGDQRILRRFEKEENVEDIKDKCFQINREEIRQKFLQRHNENYEFQRSLKLIPEFKMDASSGSGSLRNFEKFPIVGEGSEMNDIRPMTSTGSFKQKYQVSSSFMRQVPYNGRIEMLAQPKNVLFLFNKK